MKTHIDLQRKLHLYFISPAIAPPRKLPKMPISQRQNASIVATIMQMTIVIRKGFTKLEKKTPKGSKEDKKSDSDKKTFNLNEHGLNSMMLSSTNPRHYANFKAVTNISSSTVDLLRNAWVMNSGTTDHMNANRTTFKNYQTFKVPKAIYIG